MLNFKILTVILIAISCAKVVKPTSDDVAMSGAFSLDSPRAASVRFWVEGGIAAAGLNDDTADGSLSLVAPASVTKTISRSLNEGFEPKGPVLDTSSLGSTKSAPVRPVEQVEAYDSDSAAPMSPVAGLFNAIQKRKITRGEVFSADGDEISPTKRYGAGGQTLAVFQVKNGDRLRVVRHERTSERTPAAVSAQAMIVANSLFAQIVGREDFTLPGPLRTRVTGEVMEAGGKDFKPTLGRKLKPLKEKEAEDILRIIATCNEFGIIHADFKAANVVRKAEGGALAIDHGDMKVVSKMAPQEGIGGLTYLPPEAMQRVRDPLIPRPRDVRFSRAILQREILKNGPNAVNNWLLGNTLYHILTGDALNSPSSLGRPYPSSAALRAKLVDAEKDNPWIVGREDDLLSLLHPNPENRGDAAKVLARLKNLPDAPPPAVLDQWSEIL